MALEQPPEQLTPEEVGEWRKQQHKRKYWLVYFLGEVIATLALVLSIVWCGMTFFPEQSAVLLRNVVSAADRTAPFIASTNNTDSPADWPNPSRSEVIKYIWDQAPNHTVAPDWVASVCWWESGFLQYKPDVPFDVLSRQNPGSKDWGICQINDVARSNSFPTAKNSWKENINAAYAKLGECWTRFSSDLDRIQCYNGVGANNGYATRIIQIHDYRFWTGQNPIGPPLPKGYTVTQFQHCCPLGVDLGWSKNPSSVTDPKVLYATVTGVITQVVKETETNKDPDGLGNTRVVIVSDNGKWEVGYLHLDKVYVSEGQKISWGDHVGVMGSNGNAKGKSGEEPGLHVHYWIRNLESNKYENVGEWILKP